MSCCCALPQDASSEPASLATAPAWPIGPLLRLGVATLITANSVAATLALNLSEVSEQARFWFVLVLAASTLAVALLVGDALLRGIRDGWRRRQVAVEALFVLGCLGALGVTALSIARGETSLYFFETVNVLLVIYALGRQVKAFSQRRARVAAQHWSPHHQTCDRQQPDGSLQRVPVAAIRPGDQVPVRAGTEVPIDGVIVAGTALVSERALTGEPHLRSVRPGDTLQATGQVLDADLWLQATAPGTRRGIDRVTAAVEAARQHPPAIQMQADRLARAFTPVVVGVSLLTFAGWFWAQGVAAALLPALAVLLIACPCGFGFATPVAIWTGLSRLARRGLIVRDARMLEALAEVQWVLFDKTGTLTRIEPVLAEVWVRPGSGFTEPQLLQMAASVQSASEHPLAAPFMKASAQHWPVRGARLLPGVGLEAQVFAARGDVVVRLGRIEALATAADQAWLEGLPPAGAAALHRLGIQVGGQLMAEVRVAEQPRDTLAPALAALTEQGIGWEVLSGDRPDRVAALGLDRAFSHGAMTPQAKAARVAALQREGRKVLFVGDGVNDAPAMAEAHAAIALEAGATLARDTAGIGLLGTDLTAIPRGICIAQETRRRLRRVLGFALCYNSAGMVLAAAGLLHPVLAAVIMMGSSLVVNLTAGIDPDQPALPEDRLAERSFPEVDAPVPPVKTPRSLSLPVAQPA